MDDRKMSSQERFGLKSLVVLRFKVAQRDSAISCLGKNHDGGARRIEERRNPAGGMRKITQMARCRDRSRRIDDDISACHSAVERIAVLWPDGHDVAYNRCDRTPQDMLKRVGNGFGLGSADIECRPQRVARKIMGHEVIVVDHT
ncbi:MAG: hypothetical protein ABL907_02210, partial [Hyphomicrobium sp.]